jgi:positive regulator of sigma E activity
MPLGVVLHKAFEEYKLVRRAGVIWAATLITIVVLRVTSPEVIPTVTAAVATIVTAVIGILGTFLVHYQWSREKDIEAKKRGD